MHHRTSHSRRWDGRDMDITDEQDRMMFHEVLEATGPRSFIRAVP